MPELKRRPVVIIVRDGWGQNPDPKGNDANAVFLGKTPVADRLMETYPTALIHTSGEDVGLPAGIMGNSEVGHQNIGAGRIVDQELLRLSKLVRSGGIFENETLRAAMEHVKKKGSKLHFMGLASSAGVHSSLDHLDGLLEMAKRFEVPGEKVFVHCFGDGRDTAPKSGAGFCQKIEATMQRLGVGRVASVIGRYYAMDRDNRWDRVEKAYRLLTEAKGKKVASAKAAFEDYYENPTEPSRSGDEFIEPTVIVDGDENPLATIEDGDAVVFFNFRGDRPREISRAFVFDTFPYEVKEEGEATMMGFDRPKKLDLFYVTLTEYEKGLPVNVACPKPPKMAGILGMYVAELGLKQFRCAETEKFPHVTFFFNDYREEPFDGEDRQIIPSPRDVSTYDQKPEMSAYEVTEEMLRRIDSEKYDLMVLNYANGDMVGHTGSLPAAIKAVETVDECVGKIVEAVLAKGGALIVTADHGNSEQMVDPETGGPHTSHTTYDVPLIVVDDGSKGESLREGGRLADIAPTALDLLGLEKPAEMSGQSLLAK
ncbi:2,3-bisphosphoglycerate-independent phosphoglycerate mutase [Planctomycetes bacterium Pan216]|uniref:2,3-bisphosphoglycerate-independent phosphoglycerate mutase n=1 Tax=Kolteria novifilia TaxID=2527975 RepID=A0A518BD91_9BACT|nr:2,3-bisphosphoglycerate-independent phosphoglycerate mutase [Planctomycetes bacterium Pan216]